MERKNKKIGDFIMVSGIPGSGKSPLVKGLCAKSKFVNKLAFDFQGEYDEKEFTLFSKFEVLLPFLPKVEGSFIVLDESTIVIDSFKPKDLKKLIISMQHKNNVICMMFHGLRFCPPWLSDLANYIILPSPLEDAAYIKKRLPKYAERIERDRHLNTDIYIKQM